MHAGKINTMDQSNCLSSVCLSVLYSATSSVQLSSTITNRGWILMNKVNDLNDRREDKRTRGQVELSVSNDGKRPDRQTDKKSTASPVSQPGFPLWWIFSIGHSRSLPNSPGLTSLSGFSLRSGFTVFPGNFSAILGLAVLVATCILLWIYYCIIHPMSCPTNSLVLWVNIR